MNIENKIFNPEKEKQHLLNVFLDKYFHATDRGEKQESNKVVKSIIREDLERLIEQGFIMDEILQAIVERGNVLHGSSFDVNTLEPKKAMGIPEHERLTAIYATNFAPLAIFNAVTPKAKMEEPFHTCWDIKGTDPQHVESMRFRASKNALEHFGDGFVYVLDRDDVRTLPDGDFVAEKNYSPVAKIPIKRQDFVHEIEECDASYHNEDGSLKKDKL